MNKKAQRLQKVARCFIKPHMYRENSREPSSPAVILLRHNDLKGPLNAFVSLKNIPHLWVLDLFFHHKSCYRQYRDFTFSLKKNKKVRKYSLRAAVATIFVVPIIRSIGAIPVYRGKRKILETMEESELFLRQGETVVIAVDKDYSNQDAPISEIYTGFFRLEHRYFDATGEHLPFYALRFHDDHTMECSEPLTFSNKLSFSQERKIMAKTIIDFLNAPKG